MCKTQLTFLTHADAFLFTMARSQAAEQNQSGNKAHCSTQNTGTMPACSMTAAITVPHLCPAPSLATCPQSLSEASPVRTCQNRASHTKHFASHMPTRQTAAHNQHPQRLLKRGQRSMCTAAATANGFLKAAVAACTPLAPATQRKKRDPQPASSRAQSAVKACLSLSRCRCNACMPATVVRKDLRHVPPAALAAARREQAAHPHPCAPTAAHLLNTSGQRNTTAGGGCWSADGIPCSWGAGPALHHAAWRL